MNKITFTVFIIVMSLSVVGFMFKWEQSLKRDYIERNV